MQHFLNPLDSSISGKIKLLFSANKEFGLRILYAHLLFRKFLVFIADVSRRLWGAGDHEHLLPSSLAPSALGFHSSTKARAPATR